MNRGRRITISNESKEKLRLNGSSFLHYLPTKKEFLKIKKFEFDVDKAIKQIGKVK